VPLRIVGWLVYAKDYFYLRTMKTGSLAHGGKGIYYIAYVPGMTYANQLPPPILPIMYKWPSPYICPNCIVEWTFHRIVCKSPEPPPPNPQVMRR